MMTAIICGFGERPAVAHVILQPKCLFLVCGPSHPGNDFQSRNERLFFLKLLDALNHHAGLTILGDNKRVPFISRSSEIWAAWLFRYEMDLMLAIDCMLPLEFTGSKFSTGFGWCQ
jgi:hypothetical protein